MVLRHTKKKEKDKEQNKEKEEKVKKEKRVKKVEKQQKVRKNLKNLKKKSVYVIPHEERGPAGDSCAVDKTNCDHGEDRTPKQNWKRIDDWLAPGLIEN